MKKLRRYYRDCVRKYPFVCKLGERLSEEEREDERVSEKGGIDGRGGVEEGEADRKTCCLCFDLQRELQAEQQEECERLRHV